MPWFLLFASLGVTAYLYRKDISKVIVPIAQSIKNNAYIGVNSAAMPFIGTPAYIRALLNLIASGEANNGYNSYYSGARVVPRIPISQMTLAEIQQWQNANRAAGTVSTAVGRYQFIQSTFNRLTASLPLDTIFTPSLQDQLALVLITQRGLQSFINGTLSVEQFAANLAHEWAALPVNASGQSAYQGVAGNRARIAWNAFLTTLRGAR